MKCEALISQLPQGVKDLTVKDFIEKYHGSVNMFQEQQQLSEEMHQTAFVCIFTRFLYSIDLIKLID